MHRSRLGFRRDGRLGALEGVQVAVAADLDRGALPAQEGERRLARAARQEDGAPGLEDVGRARGGEACVPARRDDEMCVGPVGPEGVLGEMGDPSVLERLRGMEVLRV